MISIQPFQALRPAPQYVKQVVSIPYDVVSRIQARELSRDNPYSFLRIIRSDLEFDDSQDAYAPVIYERARENLERLKKEGVLQQDEEAHFYIYRINLNEQQQTGLVALFSASDYAQGRIKKHELTRSQKEKDRIQHIRTVRAHTGPIFLLHRDAEAPKLSSMLDEYANAHKPLYDLQDDNYSRHRFYSIASDDATLMQDLSLELEKLEAIYIADGHHRAASAAKIALEEGGQDTTNSAGYFLGVIFPDTQLHILPYNRAVHNLQGHTPESFLNAIKNESEGIQIQTGRYSPPKEHQVNMFLAGQWYQLEWQTAKSTENLSDSLTVSELQNTIIGPLLGIEDPRTSDRIDFIGGVHGEAELERLVNSTSCAVAFSLPAIQTEQLLNIADQGGIMPPKSTWFEPKLRSGFAVNLL